MNNFYYLRNKKQDKPAARRRRGQKLENPQPSNRHLYGREKNMLQLL